MLTQTSIDRAKPPTTGQRFLRDRRTRGLALRITSAGHRAFVWEGRVKGRVRRITLGPYPALTVALARKKVLAIQAGVADGKDPAVARELERGEPTLGRLAELYMERHARPRKRSAGDDERMLRDVLPKDSERKYDPAPIPSNWRTRRLSELTRGEITQLHARLNRDAGPYRANRVLALLRTMLGLAISWGLLSGDHPVRGIKMFREEARDRFLTPAELKRVLAALEDEPLEWRAFFLLSLLLGQRRSELLSARWADLDLHARCWRLPRTKAGRPHLLPLPDAAVTILKALPSRGRGEWVFPSPASGSGHLEDPKKAWGRIRDRAGVTDVRIHDLRRTLGSWLAASGYGLPIVGRVLGHTQPSATAVYARLHLEPVREALEANARAMLGAATSEESR